MILRNQVEWALHCCSILRMLPNGKYITTRDLALFHGVPKEYLSKALQALSRKGIVENLLGASGGYRLARHPKDISFLDIVEAIEGKQYMFKCTEIRKNIPCQKPGYKFDTKCAIARVMHKADDVWRQQLLGVSLADLGEILSKEIPSETLEKINQWLVDHS